MPSTSTTEPTTTAPSTTTAAVTTVPVATTVPPTTAVPVTPLVTTVPVPPVTGVVVVERTVLVPVTVATTQAAAPRTLPPGSEPTPTRAGSNNEAEGDQAGFDYDESGAGDDEFGFDVAGRAWVVPGFDGKTIVLTNLGSGTNPAFGPIGRSTQVR